jgi:hypothetical protein
MSIATQLIKEHRLPQVGPGMYLLNAIDIDSESFRSDACALSTKVRLYKDETIYTFEDNSELRTDNLLVYFK